MIDTKKVIELYTKQNKSTYEIAEELNTYPNKIRRVLIKNGVDLKGKSEAQKNAIENGKAIHPTKGKNRSQEEKIKISSGIKNYWSNMDEKTYKEKVDKSKKRWENMSEQQKTLMLDSAIKAIQVAGKEGSKLEKFLYEAITHGGYAVEFHKKYLIQNEYLEIDMYIPSLKTIIEVDGPSHFLPIWGEEKLRKQIKADVNKNGLILSKGYVIIRIKNLSDSICLSDREKLRLDILDRLSTIEKSFPSKSERYIEIEI
jgi:very-short-patch-repair endonuclease